MRLVRTPVNIRRMRLGYAKSSNLKDLAIQHQEKLNKFGTIRAARRVIHREGRGSITVEEFDYAEPKPLKDLSIRHHEKLSKFGLVRTVRIYVADGSGRQHPSEEYSYNRKQAVRWISFLG